MLNNLLRDPKTFWIASWLLSSFASDFFWSFIGRLVGFDVSEQLVTMLIGPSPASGWIWLFRVIVALTCGLIIVWAFVSFQSKHKTKIKRAQKAVTWSVCLALFALASFVSFSAGQDRPSIRTIAGLLNPLGEMRAEKHRIVLEVNSTQLIQYAGQFELIGICRVISDATIDRGFMGAGDPKRDDSELQRSGVYPISNPMEINLPFGPKYPLWDGFCRDGGRKIQCGVRAVTKDEGTDFRAADGRLFSHFATYEGFTEEDRQNLCGG